MWRRVSAKLQTLAPWRSALKPNRSFPFAEHQKTLRNGASTSASTSTASSPFQKTANLFSEKATSDADTILGKGRKGVEDVMPIATGHEREEIEADLQGRNLAAMDYPVGPFGTKEAPAIIKSIFNKRIVGCPGGEGEDEHDVVWFWLEKGKPHECPVCSQYFMLDVVGPGGPPDGHDDEDHH